MKNYTSGVPVDRTISRIESVLAKAGAHGIMKDYKDGVVVALCFIVRLPSIGTIPGKPVSVRLPINVDAVEEVLRQDVKRPRKGTLAKLRQQAERTAWKLMQDWVEVQISLIQMQQADFMQVFLPYVWDGKQTFYGRLKGTGFLELPEAREESR